MQANTHDVLVDTRDSRVNISSQKNGSKDKTSVIRQKDESQNGGNKKTKHAKFSEKRTFLTSRKCSFFGKFGMLCFLVTSVLRFPLLPYYQ